jgi:hypothetical protein
VIIPALMALFSESRGSLTRGYLPDTEEAVQNRAYELYQQRGAGPGDSEHDWLKAEKEILFRNPKKTDG